MRKFAFFSLLVLLGALFTVSLTSAQGAWQVTLAFTSQDQTNFSGEIRVLNEMGLVQTVVLPNQLGSNNALYASAPLVSDDLRYTVLVQNHENGVSLRIFDSQAATCCLDLSANFTLAQAIDLGGFEANSSRFALSYVNKFDSSPNIPEGGIMIIDAATGNIQTQLTMEVIQNQMQLPNGGGIWALMGDWTANGIEFIPNCYGCEGIFEGIFHLYDPTTNFFSANTGSYFSLFGRELSATGELIYPAQDKRYIYDATPAGFWGMPNVVYYFSATPQSESPLVFQPTPFNTTVAYAASDVVNIQTTMWVDNGSAFLVEPFNTDFWELVFRDGTVRRVHKTPETRALVGLPNGWLAATETSIQFYNMQNLMPVELGTIPAQYSVEVIDSQVPLAQPASTQGFSLVNPPAQSYGVCPNGMITYLSMGGRGRITPGSSNRIREAPTTDSTQIGQIPAGGEFAIIDGPYCDDINSYIWWYVDYNGLQGWTVEASGNEYWIEAISR